MRLDARGAGGRHVGLWRGFTSASLAMAGRFLARAAWAAREPKYRLEEQLGLTGAGRGCGTVEDVGRWLQKRVDVRVAGAIVPSSVSDECEGRFKDGRATTVSWAANLLVSTPLET